MCVRSIYSLSTLYHVYLKILKATLFSYRVYMFQWNYLVRYGDRKAAFYNPLYRPISSPKTSQSDRERDDRNTLQRTGPPWSFTRYTMPCPAICQWLELYWEKTKLLF